MDATVIARRLTGAAHVRTIDEAAAWELSGRGGRQLSVVDGGARIYFEGFDPATAEPHVTDEAAVCKTVPQAVTTGLSRSMPIPRPDPSRPSAIEGMKQLLRANCYEGRKIEMGPNTLRRN